MFKRKAGIATIPKWDDSRKTSLNIEELFSIILHCQSKSSLLTKTKSPLIKNNGAKHIKNLVIFFLLSKIISLHKKIINNIELKAKKYLRSVMVKILSNLKKLKLN